MSDLKKEININTDLYRNLNDFCKNTLWIKVIKSFYEND